MIQICICCSCFLAVIYGIARLDKVHRRYKNDEITTMAEKKSEQEIFTPQRIMYITFEDGPGLYTQDILYILDRYDIKATFFVTGMDQEYTHLLKDINKTDMLSVCIAFLMMNKKSTVMSMLILMI